MATTIKDTTTNALLLKAFETYDHVTQGYFMHTKPPPIHSYRAASWYTCKMIPLWVCVILSAALP